MNNEPHRLDSPTQVGWLRRGFLLVLTLAVLAELVVHLHPKFAIESVFGFYAWFGFLACVAMIVVARALGLLLERPHHHHGVDDA